MKLGILQGVVWATVKDPKLDAVRFAIMQPVDEDLQPQGRPMVAADTISGRDGDLVYWVGGGEATRPFPGRMIPSDATIVGLVDRVDHQARNRQ